MDPVEDNVRFPPPQGNGDHVQDITTLEKELQRLFFRYGFRLNRVFPKDGSEGLTAYTDTPDTKPAAADHEGAIIYVSDGGAGAKFRGSDGTSWVNLG